MADSQVPWGIAATNGSITEPAWKAKPSWYLVATDDRMTPPPAQQFMSKRAGSTVTEVKGSHAVYTAQPDAVAALIDKAARGVKSATKWARRKAAGGALGAGMPIGSPHPRAQVLGLLGSGWEQLRG